MVQSNTIDSINQYKTGSASLSKNGAIVNWAKRSLVEQRSRYTIAIHHRVFGINQADNVAALPDGFALIPVERNGGICSAAAV
jgi:hypothetical protein